MDEKKQSKRDTGEMVGKRALKGDEGQQYSAERPVSDSDLAAEYLRSESSAKIRCSCLLKLTALAFILVPY